MTRVPKVLEISFNFPHKGNNNVFGKLQFSDSRLSKCHKQLNLHSYFDGRAMTDFEVRGAGAVVSTSTLGAN